MSGPKNHDENRLRRPPHYKFKAALDIKMYKIIEMAPAVNKLGYKELFVHPDPIYKHNQSLIANPGTEVAFWCSQGNRHSTIIYKNELYALMGVSAKRKRDPDSQTHYLVNKKLEILSINWDSDVEEWIHERIGEFLKNGPTW